MTTTAYSTSEVSSTSAASAGNGTGAAQAAGQPGGSRLELALSPTTTPLDGVERARRLQTPGFGRIFTEHMVSARWTAGKGWHDASLSAYQPLQLDPATMALHYGQAIFEGLKAYRQAGGGIATFRPDQNAARFRRSARRMAMPELPDDFFVAAVEALVRQDRDWVPDNEDESLYLRPFMFATEVGLGVRPAAEHLFLLLASPAGAYFPRGVKPVSVWLSTEYTRAAPGGTGEAKCAGNYAASLVAQREAAEAGCDQVVWLDAVEHAWVEEMGGMNLFFVLRPVTSGGRPRLVTPALTGTLLPGITRDSLLTLADDLGYDAEERPVSVEEWRAGNASGEITEVFACGTAAVITPVGQVKSAAGEWTVGDGSPGPVTTELRRTLLEIQRGHAPDKHGWVHRIL